MRDVRAIGLYVFLQVHYKDRYQRTNDVYLPERSPHRKYVDVVASDLRRFTDDAEGTSIVLRDQMT
ncbi:Hypothetical predicted protein [Mytilus galloprovincialis]|uniref:Uncharacterized protein n=1 Tax=Mytilus galloprovincialis TaxID=29158 RepID=A0A8B6GXQ7_MYTGA|nr:Hypothetical predicted protein [Mytilus galloprovincialis]